MSPEAGAEAATGLSVHDRVVAVLEGRTPDRLPFCDRLVMWHTGLIRQGRLPAEFEGMTLEEIHRAVGLGQQKWVPPYALRLRGVEMVVTRDNADGTQVVTETDPAVEFFPMILDVVELDRPGTTTIELRTKVGTLRLKLDLIEEAVLWGEHPYMVEHPIKEPADFAVAEHILEQIEYVPLYERFRAEEESTGENGFVVGWLQRIPFQEVLIGFMGEMECFFALHDDPGPVRRLLQALHEVRLHVIDELAGLDCLYVEFPDNLTAPMTNPKLFAEFCLPHYQEYAELFHRQGKKVGSHTDGDLGPLLGLLQESGLDVCESFSPSPLTQTTFDDAWQAWQGRPIMWGAIPTPLLEEERTSEPDFRAYVDHVLETVGSGAIILGPSDMVLAHNSIERVRWIAERVEEHELA